MRKKVIFGLFFFVKIFSLFSQNSNEKELIHKSLSITVQSKTSKEPLEYAHVSLGFQGKFFFAHTNLEGCAKFMNIPLREYFLRVSYIGFKEHEQKILFSGKSNLIVELEPLSVELQELYVTATESTGITSTSTITRAAMEHLQPTSFTDLLELLPGGASKDPNMSIANRIKLREVGRDGDKDDISSLGIAFLVDDRPLREDANLQELPKATVSDVSYNLRMVNKGVDTRTISTDNIERVEIIRGVPSVEYGEMTGGIVKITRKLRPTRWETRLKSDEYGKLFSVGKGFHLGKKKDVLMFNVDYLDSKADPRDHLRNYKRLTGSVRMQKTWADESHSLRWRSALDYTGSFDNIKKDPDISALKVDFYKSSYNKTAVSSNFEYKSLNSNLLKSIDLNSSLTFQQDNLIRKKYISIIRPTPIPNNMTEGVHDGVYLPYQYVADFESDGRPFYSFVKLRSLHQVFVGKAKNDIKSGVEWDYSKNFGRGQVYDINRPISPEWDTRPRAYSTIPAYQKISVFWEDYLSLPLKGHEFHLVFGIRTMTLAGLDKAFAMHNRVYWEPRANTKWKFKGLNIVGKQLLIELGAGGGLTTKLPTLAHLYPQKYYNDLVQLNYFHEKEDFRRLNIRTYIIDKTNYDLQPARNLKWEFRADFSYNSNRLTITYFNEKLNSGFRNLNFFQTYVYNKYDIKSVDGSTLTKQPELDDFSHKIDTILAGHPKASNGSALYKEGIEFQFSSKRIKAINTKITFNGAWFKSTYVNSLPMFKTVSAVVFNEAVQFRYVGLYNEEDGAVRQQLSTNCVLDTQIPKLGLIFSASVQCQWFQWHQRKYRSEVPTDYLDRTGTLHPYTDADAKDAIKQHLIDPLKSVTSVKMITPFFANINLKVSKEMSKLLKISLFVNRIFNYHPDYYSNGFLVRRHEDSYFGIELNCNF